MLIRTIAITLTAAVLGACSTTPMPPGQETSREFTQVSSVPYKDAYRIIAKQMRACFRIIGIYGNGYDVHADLDANERVGRVELYYVGLAGAGASKPEDSMFSRTIVIKAQDKGSVITVTGTTPQYVYRNSRSITAWLAGNENCAAGN
jgi:hypothetical protein